MRDYIRSLSENISHRWRTSLQVRVITSIFAATSVVMLILGLAMMSVVTQRLMDIKVDTASSEIDRARAAVEQQINATGEASSVQVRLNSARTALTTNNSSLGENSAVYEPVLLLSNPDGSTVTSPQGYAIPDPLRRFVDEGQVSYQFAPVERPDGESYNALIVGSPTEADLSGVQVYLVISMESDMATVALMRGLISAAAVVVVVLLVGITWLFAQQVISPIRSASRIAERLASGHLRERMAVDSEDEVASLAISFNSMAESLESQINQLRRYGDLQRQFTSDVSHELRTPLSTVRMAADTIEARSVKFDANTRRVAELMVEELDRFEGLLNDLLEISRYDAGDQELAESEFDAKACIREAHRQVEPLAENLNVDMHFEGTDQPLYMVGDNRRVERIMRNLLANAIDHSEPNPVIVEWAGNDSAIAITVTDHGVGLSPGQEKLVFNRFWRADPSRVRRSGGTGLGLAIAQEDAMLHGGMVDADGTLGIGSQFRLVLPRKPGGRVTQAPLELKGPTTKLKPGEQPRKRRQAKLEGDGD